MKSRLIALLAATVGCGLTQPALAAQAVKARERVLHSFSGPSADGANPYSGLIDVNSLLYGTTQSGGSGTCPYTCGTVFAIDPRTGTEKVVYSFCSQYNCTDGEEPYSGLVDVKGTVYGTTADGGAYGQGTVFAFNPKTGVETTIYSFCPPQEKNDGGNPEATMIVAGDKLYGTTNAGGAFGHGIVFALDLHTGIETMLHSFGSGSDGQAPASSLIKVEGKLYGTTIGGGTSGAGTGFAIELKTGVESVLYSFRSQQNCTDGQAPYAALIHVNGALYGTTLKGGASGNGTAFSIDLNTGVESVLYSFCSQQNCADGQFPTGDLIDVKGTLYGTTGGGGSTNGCCGTVFSLNRTTGAETVLYSFCPQAQNCTDGNSPLGGLIVTKHTLYGTTVSGGVYGDGVAFAINTR